MWGQLPKSRLLVARAAQPRFLHFLPDFAHVRHPDTDVEQLRNERPRHRVCPIYLVGVRRRQRNLHRESGPSEVPSDGFLEDGDYCCDDPHTASASVPMATHLFQSVAASMSLTLGAPPDRALALRPGSPLRPASGAKSAHVGAVYRRQPQVTVRGMGSSESDGIVPIRIRHHAETRHRGCLLWHFCSPPRRWRARLASTT